LEQKYGADHPRVKKIAARIDYNQGAFQEVDGEIQRSEIIVPELDINTWMVHGRVLDQQGTGISGLTLALYDASGQVERQLGFACTDDRGYYAIRFQVEEGTPSPIDEATGYYLTVTDSGGKILHRETEPSHVVIGEVDYRLIILSDTVCTPPPGWDTGGEGGGEETGLWSVRGSVVYDDNTPAAGLIVSVYDKDLIFDDALGTTKTDDNGLFGLVYRTDAFRDLFESRPDLYLKILDQKGNPLYVSDKAVRAEAGRVEEFNIVLKRKKPRQTK
jgi:hypothetical protein